MFKLHFFLSFFFIRCLLTTSDGDCQTAERHHWTGAALPVARGEILLTGVQCYANEETERFSILSLQHQQQVASAVERAKQVTMTELNAVIGVIYLFLFTFILSLFFKSGQKNELGFSFPPVFCRLLAMLNN